MASTRISSLFYGVLSLAVLFSFFANGNENSNENMDLKGEYLGKVDGSSRSLSQGECPCYLTFFGGPSCDSSDKIAVADLSFGLGCYYLNISLEFTSIDVYNCTEDTIDFLAYTNDDCSQPVNGSYYLEWNAGCADLLLISADLEC